MNKFKVGDLVEILPLTDAQKRAYPPTWMKDMDNYIGLITTVERVSPTVDTNSKILMIGHGTR